MCSIHRIMNSSFLNAKESIRHRSINQRMHFSIRGSQQKRIIRLYIVVDWLPRVEHSNHSICNFSLWMRNRLGHRNSLKYLKLTSTWQYTCRAPVWLWMLYKAVSYGEISIIRELNWTLSNTVDRLSLSTGSKFSRKARRYGWQLTEDELPRWWGQGPSSGTLLDQST